MQSHPYWVELERLANMTPAAAQAADVLMDAAVEGYPMARYRAVTKLQAGLAPAI